MMPPGIGFSERPNGEQIDGQSGAEGDTRSGVGTVYETIGHHYALLVQAFSSIRSGSFLTDCDR
jgi:hypothetical protein